jgi:hypothetical protein
MKLPFDFTRLYFKGKVHSSGGTGSPCFDWPDSSNRQGQYCNQNTCNNEMRNGGINVDREDSMPSESGRNNVAIWHTWSDTGNVCGRSGCSWELYEIMVR